MSAGVTMAAATKGRAAHRLIAVIRSSCSKKDCISRSPEKSLVIVRIMTVPSSSPTKTCGGWGAIVSQWPESAATPSRLPWKPLPR